MMRAAPIFLGLLVFAGLARAAEIHTTGERLDDTIAAIGTQDGRQVVTTGSGRSIALEDVKDVRFSDRAPPRLRDVHVVLLSGDELNGTVGDEVKKGESFKLSTISLGSVEVNLDAVGVIIFDVRPEAEEKLLASCAAWLDGRAPRPKNDSFTLLAGGGAQGTVVGFSRDGLVFRDTQDASYPPFLLKRLEMLVLGGGGTVAPRPHFLGVRLRLADGSVVSGPVVDLANGTLRIADALGKGGVLSVDTKQILALEVLGGAVTYLSDLEPVSVDEHFPRGFERDGTFAWKRDGAVVEGHLRLGGRTYAKGLGVHSYSSLTFAVEGYRELRAVIGLDDTTRYMGEASVVFRVLLDGTEVKTVAVNHGDAPSELVVPLGGKKKLTLVADYGKYLHVLGRADWADAHLVK